MRRFTPGLGIAALVASLSGCCETAAYSTPEVENADTGSSPVIKNLSTDELEPMADEKYVVDTANLDCEQAEVEMNVEGYFIICDYNHFFCT